TVWQRQTEEDDGMMPAGQLVHDALVHRARLPESVPDRVRIVLVATRGRGVVTAAGGEHLPEGLRIEQRQVVGDAHFFSRDTNEDRTELSPRRRGSPSARDGTYR